MRRTKHAKVKHWLTARPRFHLHFTPTYSSWRNQVERWFGLLSRRAIVRGSFRSVPDLVRRIQAFVNAYNASATPFVWVATALSDHLQGVTTCNAYFRDGTLGPPAAAAGESE